MAENLSSVFSKIFAFLFAKKILKLVCETKLTFDSITTDDTYYIFAYYNKTGIEDGKSYVTRVSDNFIKIEKSGSGITASIVATSTEIG